MAQPLAGIACDAPGSWRVKPYLPFRDGAGDEPLDIGRRLTGCPDLARRLGGRALHLLEVVLGPGGISGVKLYFLVPDAPTGRTAAMLGGTVPLLDDLASRGVAQVRDLLAVHRAAWPDDPAVDRVAEVDFSLPDNGLLWTDVAGPGMPCSPNTGRRSATSRPSSGSPCDASWSRSRAATR